MRERIRDVGQYFLFVQYSCRNSHLILLDILHGLAGRSSWPTALTSVSRISYLTPLALHHVLRRAGTRVHPEVPLH